MARPGFLLLVQMAGVCLLASTLFATDGVDDELYPRFLTHAAPQLERGPEIDGSLDPREWAPAAQLPPLLRTMDGALAPQETAIYLAYTDTTLYVGWQVHRAPDAGAMRIEVAEPGRHEGRGVWLDDCMELYLDLDGRDTAIVFAGNAAGAFGDGLARGTTDFDHSWAWEYAARETDFGWEGELAIAFEELDLDGAPEEGETWGFDIVRNNKTPNQEAMYTSYRGSWHDRGKFSRLRFGGVSPAVRVIELGAVGDEAIGSLAEVMNPSDRPVKVTAEYTIYRRPSAMGRFNFFEQVDSGVSDPETQDVITMATVEDQVAEVLGLYEQVEERSVTRESPPRGRAAFNLSAGDVPVGDYMIGYRFRDESGRLLAAGLRPATRWAPLHVEIVPYYLVADLIDAEVSVHSEQVSDALKTIGFRLIQNGEAMLEKQVAPEEARQGVGLSTEAVVPGAYRLEVIAQDGDGAVVAEVTHDMHRPEPPFWAVQEYGTSSFVPEPWDPVEVEDHVARVWGRSYCFDNGFIPAQIESQGASLLTAPPRLVLRVDGERVEWSGTLQVAKQNEEYVDFAWQGHAGSIPVSARTRVEFDGFVTIDLDLDTGQRVVDEFAVEFPIRSDEVDLYNFTVSRYATQRTSDIPEAGVLTEGFNLGFKPAVWLGNTQRGLQWCADSSEHWHNEDEARAIEVTPGEQETVLRLQVVDHSVQTPERMSYRWGLMASPVKEYDRPEHQELYYSQHGMGRDFYRGDEEAVEQFRAELAMAQEMGANWINTFQWLNRYEPPIGPDTFGEPYIEDPDHVAAHREGVDMIREHGMQSTAYTGWNAMHPNMSWWPFYGEAMKMTPSRFSFGGYKPCMRGGYVDYQANGTVWMIENLGVAGVYLDGTAGLNPCYDRHHGCGYVDPETGERVVTFNIWEHRELFKRMYKITHGEVIDDGLIYSHAGGPPLLAIESFVDARHGAEGDELEEYLDLDGFRAKYYGRMYGLPLELTWVYHAPHNLVWGIGMMHDTPIKMYHHLFTRARSRSDNYDEPHIGWRMWAPRQWFDWESNYRWYPYYSNKDVLTVDDEHVPASFHHNGEGQAILIAVNTHEDARTAELAFDVDRLGWADNLHARDAVTNEVFEIHDGRFELELLGHRPRVLMIDVAPVPSPELASRLEAYEE